jgi:hypothetical protein
MENTIEERRRKNRERSAKYRRENPEKWKEIDRRAKAKQRSIPENLDRIREYQLRYREENRRALSDKERQRRLVLLLKSMPNFLVNKMALVQFVKNLRPQQGWAK